LAIEGGQLCWTVAFLAAYQFYYLDDTLYYLLTNKTMMVMTMLMM